MIAHHSIILIKIMTIQTITWNIVVKKITENNVPLIQKRNFSRSVGRADSIIEDLHVGFQGCRNFIHTIYLVTQETTVLWIAMLTSLWLPLDTFITRTLTQFSISVMFVQSEITLLRTEVAQLKSLLLAHKDCPVTIAQQRNAQMLSKYLNWKSCSKLIKQSIT